MADEPGHAALAIGEYYRATGEMQLDKRDLVDLAARCITAQAFTEEDNESGLAYAALGLLSFGPSKERNTVWERLMEPTRACLDKRLLARTDYQGYLQAFNVAKAVARYSMGLSKKDETGKLIDLFIERINQSSSTGFCDDNNGAGIGGVFDIYGLLSFIFIRQSLKLHANVHLCERKLPSLRTYAEKYIKMIPDLVRSDGLGWAYGSHIGAYGQMYCISILLQAMRDNWIPADQMPMYFDLLRRLFHFFFVTYLDQENGFIVIRDNERDTHPVHTTRCLNFDAARYLCQWARLAKSIGIQMTPKAALGKTAGRYISFDKTNRKEQGLFIYQNSKTGLHIQLPLISSGKSGNADSLAFPHCPGIFDWPVNRYLPILQPELTFGDKVTIPSFYGLRCVTGLGLKNSFYFRYEQPELITKDEEIVPGIGSCKVTWTFADNKVTGEFIYTVKAPIQLDCMRYVIALGMPHSTYRIGSTFALGPESLRATVVKDDFQAEWKDTEVVSTDPTYATFYGKIHYIQTLTRNHPLLMRPGQQYRLTLSFDPDIVLADELQG